MDLEQLRNNWQKTRINSELLDADTNRLTERLASGRAQTARAKLARYYRRSALCAILLPALSPILVISLGFPEWIAAIYAWFGVVMGVLNLCFSRYISRCDYTSQPIVTALASAVKIARIQRYLRAFGMFTGADCDNVCRCLRPLGIPYNNSVYRRARAGHCAGHHKISAHVGPGATDAGRIEVIIA